jgi:RND family efflux transporter MFP subunit
MRNLFLASIIVAGCDPEHSHDSAHEHAPEETTLQRTVWDGSLEIFLEHKRPVVDVPTSFLVHVTDLASMEPPRNGKLVLVFRHGDGPTIEQAEEGPKRPGIYVSEVRLPKPGRWTFRLRVGGREIGLPEVTAYPSREEALRAPEEEVREGIRFLKEQQWKLGTRIEPAGTRTLVERLHLPAVVAAKPGSRASVLPPVQGRVLSAAGKPFPTLGERVEAGQVLGLVQPPFSDLSAKLVEAEAELARARLSLSQAEQSHARMERLAAGGARSARELEESSFAVQGAKAALEAARALRNAYQGAGFAIREEQGGLPVLELRAPIAGLVVKVGAAIGEQVPENRAVFELLSSETVLVEARVPEADVLRLGASRAAVYETPAARGRFETLGRLVFLGPEVDVANRSVPLVFEASNPDGRLRVGMAIVVHVETGRAEEAPAVPEGSLVEEEGRPVLYVQVAGETFERREVRIGIRDSGFVQIVEGLRAGERVVTRGAYSVRLASASSALPAHGHSH